MLDTYFILLPRTEKIERFVFAFLLCKIKNCAILTDESGSNREMIAKENIHEK